MKHCSYYIEYEHDSMAKKRSKQQFSYVGE